jgi:competence ComEA-like helix-hairpin-helix protein
MKTGKPYYFNKYVCLPKFLLSVVFSFLLVCCQSKPSQKVLTSESGKLFSENSININMASAKDLEKLPQIGEKTAQNIIEHRQKYGKFRKPEHLILVKGISDNKFRQLKNFVTTE